MIGIYKITSPTGRVYIGQSITIEKRFAYYRQERCKSQPKLYLSLKKHGWRKHSFEIISECKIEELNNMERYFQDVYFKTSPKKSLNCILTDTSTIKRLYSDETKAKMSRNRKGIVAKRVGFKHSEHSKKLMSLASTGRKATKEQRQKMVDSHESNFDSRRKPILNTQTGEIYKCMKTAAKSLGLAHSTIRQKLNPKYILKISTKKRRSDKVDVFLRKLNEEETKEYNREKYNKELNN